MHHTLFITIILSPFLIHPIPLFIITYLHSSFIINYHPYYYYYYLHSSIYHSLSILQNLLIHSLLIILLIIHSISSSSFLYSLLYLICYESFSFLYSSLISILYSIYFISSFDALYIIRNSYSFLCHCSIRLNLTFFYLNLFIHMEINLYIKN